jgi:hypothetical protein
MIELNEEYIIDTLQELGLSQNSIDEFLSRFAGNRIYIRKKGIEKKQIKKDYYKLIKTLPRNEVIHILAKNYEKNLGTIRGIINKF